MVHCSRGMNAPFAHLHVKLMKPLETINECIAAALSSPQCVRAINSRGGPREALAEFGIIRRVSNAESASSTECRGRVSIRSRKTAVQLPHQSASGHNQGARRSAVPETTSLNWRVQPNVAVAAGLVGFPGVVGTDLDPFHWNQSTVSELTGRRHPIPVVIAPKIVSPVAAVEGKARVDIDASASTVSIRRAGAANNLFTLDGSDSAPLQTSGNTVTIPGGVLVECQSGSLRW